MIITGGHNVSGAEAGTSCSSTRRCRSVVLSPRLTRNADTS